MSRAKGRRKSSRPYEWTAVKPTKSGYYWYRSHAGASEVIVRIYRLKSEPEYTIRFSPHKDDVNWLCNQPGHFAGPIRTPVEPPGGVEELDEKSMADEMIDEAMET